MSEVANESIDWMSSGGEVKKIYPRGTWKSVERYSNDALKRAESWAHWNFW